MPPGVGVQSYTTSPAGVCVGAGHVGTRDPTYPCPLAHPLPSTPPLGPHSPFSFSPNMVRKTVKLMGPGASFTMASSSSFFTLMRPGGG